MQMDLKHLPVNWIDGMKISRKNFLETDSFVQEQVQDVRAQLLNDFNYGILSADKSLDLSVSSDSNQLITIDLASCKAVTPNGCRIELNKQNAVKTVINFKDVMLRFGLKNVTVQPLFILLSIDPFNRVPTGEPLVDETPPRVPYTQPEIKLDLIPAEAINQFFLGNTLIIGKIIYQGNELSFQKDFIPAAVSIESLPLLQDWYKKFRQQLESWEVNCVRIIQKINSKTQQVNTLTTTILKITEKVAEKLALQKINYQWIAAKSPPVYLCELLLTNIQYLYTLLVCLPEKDREELLNYFAEWADVSTGSIENITMKTLQVPYTHNDVANVFREIQSGYNLYFQIFQKLAQLEFIGKRKGQNIFVIEQEVKEVKPNVPNQPEKPGRWSPLT